MTYSEAYLLKNKGDQMTDFSRYGSKEAIIKFFRIIGWYAASGAVASLVALLSGVVIDQKDIVAVLAVMSANAVLAAIVKWLSSCKPE